MNEDGRGFYWIGVERIKNPINVGTLWRSAAAMGAAGIFVVGRRYPPQASDTVKAWRHVPYMEFSSIEDLVDHLPVSCPLIGVDDVEGAHALEDFVHPERGAYLLGSEDAGLSRKALDAVHGLVEINTARCLNVASAGSIVMYDRRTKGTKWTPSRTFASSAS